MRTKTSVGLSASLLVVGLMAAFALMDRDEVVGATGAEAPAGAIVGTKAGAGTETEASWAEGEKAETAGGSGIFRTWESNTRLLKGQVAEGCPEWSESASSCRPFDVDPPRPPRIPLSDEVLDAALEGCAEAGGVKIEAEASWILVPDCSMAWSARTVATPAPSPIYRDNPVEDGPPVSLGHLECLLDQQAEGLRLFLLAPPDPEGAPSDGNIAGVADFRLSCCEDCNGKAESER